MSRLSKINDLAFDLVHEYMEPQTIFLRKTDIRFI